MQNSLLNFSSRYRQLAICLALLAMPTAPKAFAQSSDEAKAAKFSLVRSFSLPSRSAEERSELFRKGQGDAVLADSVDLNLKFSAEHGKSELASSQFFAPEKAHTSILRFPDGWLTVNMVSADGKGAFICRVKVKTISKPEMDKLLKYAKWCQASLTLATLDPDFMRDASQP